jgi:hypothetical protein
MALGVLNSGIPVVQSFIRGDDEYANKIFNLSGHDFPIRDCDVRSDRALGHLLYSPARIGIPESTAATHVYSSPFAKSLLGSLYYILRRQPQEQNKDFASHLWPR